VIYCDSKYYWLSNSDPISTITDAGDLDALNSSSYSGYTNSLQIVSKRFRAQTLSFDSSFIPSFTDTFTANDLPTTNSSIYIDDYMITTSPLGVIKLINNSFVTFQVNGAGQNTYFHRRNLTNFKAYYFDQVNKCFYWGNGTEIMNTTFNVTKNAAGTVTNVSMVDTVLYRKLNHTNFMFSGAYLLIGCSTCDNNVGRI
jgi:hypothetical protein